MKHFLVVVVLVALLGAPALARSRPATFAAMASSEESGEDSSEKVIKADSQLNKAIEYLLELIREARFLITKLVSVKEMNQKPEPIQQAGVGAPLAMVNGVSGTNYPVRSSPDKHPLKIASVGSGEAANLVHAVQFRGSNDVHTEEGVL